MSARLEGNTKSKGRGGGSHVTHIVGVSPTVEAIAYVAHTAGAVPLALTHVHTLGKVTAATVVLKHTHTHTYTSHSFSALTCCGINSFKIFFLANMKNTDGLKKKKRLHPHHFDLNLCF